MEPGAWMTKFAIPGANMWLQEPIRGWNRQIIAARAMVWLKVAGGGNYEFWI